MTDIKALVVSAKQWQAKLEENTKLKELLKECGIANETLVCIMDWLRQSVIPEQRECCEELFVKVQKLQTLIDEVLK